MLDEEFADSICDKLSEHTVQELVPKDRPALPVANDDDTVLEIAAMMAANRSPLVAVLDGKGKHAPLLGAVSIYDLLGRLLADPRSEPVRWLRWSPATESHTSLVRRARKIDRVLAQTYPDARCELDFDNPFELLVVTVLSAQTTDKRVNAVRPTLFAAYPDAPAMAAAEREKLEAIIGPLGFFRAKTESLLKLSAALVERHGGEVPPGSRTWSSCPASAARPPTSCSATPSASPASPSTPTSAGWRAGSAGPRRPTRSRPSTPSVRCSPRRTG